MFTWTCCYDPPFFSPLCLLLFTHVASRTMYCHFISFGLLYYLLHSCAYWHCHRCFLFSILSFTCSGTCMTLFDSFLLYFTQRLHILYHHLFFYLLLLSVLACPFLFLSFTYQSSTHFSLRLIHSLLCLIHVLLVYSIAYMYLVWLGCRLVIYKGAVMSLEG